MKRLLIITFFVLAIMASPLKAYAFDPAQLIDPLCLFACDDNTKPDPAQLVDPLCLFACDTGHSVTYNNSSNESSLTASCYSTYSTAYVGDQVTWRVNAFGGNGNYSYSWSGTNGLSGNSSSVYITYNSSGSKSATVRVTSGGQSIVKDCGSIVIYNGNSNPNPPYPVPPPPYYPPVPPPPAVPPESILTASCYSTYSTAYVGDQVTWRVNAFGGNGNYSYSWSGTNGLSGNSSSVYITYNSSGSKSATVRITSGGQSIVKDCGSIVVYGRDNNNYDHNYDNHYDDYHNDYNNDNYSSLSASCYSTYSYAGVDELVTWRVNAFGGNGNYSYSWSGTNGLSGSNSSVNKRYSSAGTKRASVEVRSGGRTITRDCGTVEVTDYGRDNYRNDDYYRDYDNNRYYRDYNYDRDTLLSVSCSVNTTFAPVGTRVSWQAYPSGGNGIYNYTWYGTDSIRSYNRLAEVIYNSPGTKTAYVIVRSGNQSVTQYCSNSVVVGSPTFNYQYNPPVYSQPVYIPPKTVVKYVQVPDKTTSTTKTTVVKEVKEPTKVTTEKDDATLASLFSLKNVPWGWVAVLVILVLLFLVIYLAFSNKKI